MNKIEDEAYNLFGRWHLTTFKGKLEVDALTLLFAKVDAITQRMNVNAANSSSPSPCEICGPIEHVTLNWQVVSHFFQDPSEVNYI